MVGQGRRPGLATLNLPGGDFASRQGDRDGGQGERQACEGSLRPAAASAGSLRQRAHPARGYGAPETTEAFAAVRELGYRGNVEPERLAADYGLWVGSCVRGELAAMRAHAAFRRDFEARPESPEAGIAQRILGATHRFAGEYVEARDHLERALALFQPGRDDDLAFRFGQDAGVASMLYLALTLWPLGDVGRAVSLVGGWLACAAVRAGGSQSWRGKRRGRASSVARCAGVARSQRSQKDWRPREDISFLVRRAGGGEGKRRCEAGSAAMTMRCRS